MQLLKIVHCNAHLADLPHHIEPLPEVPHCLLVNAGAVHVVLKQRSYLNKKTEEVIKSIRGGFNQLFSFKYTLSSIKRLSKLFKSGRYETSLLLLLTTSI